MNSAECSGVSTGKNACPRLRIPEKANRPFDKNRSGFLFAEGGAAMLILESKEHADSRGAVPIAEVAAFAESFDAVQP